MMSFAVFEAAMLWVSRMPYILARERYLPRASRDILAATETPWKSIVLCCAVFTLLVTLGFLALVVLDVFFYMAALMLEMLGSAEVAAAATRIAKGCSSLAAASRDYIGGGASAVHLGRDFRPRDFTRRRALRFSYRDRAGIDGMARIRDSRANDAAGPPTSYRGV